MSEEKKTYTLSQLNQSLERFIREHFAYQLFWVVAEITKVQDKNGHYYLELADSKEGKRTAEMSANMWFSAFTQVNRRLNNELPRLFQAGNKVLIQVKIEFHTIYGLKLNVLDVDPDMTYGELERKKQATIKRLREEGLLDVQKGLYLPPVVKRIGLIGSPKTSGYRDFLTQLKQNNIYTNFTVKEFAAAVQGERAVAQIVQAIQKASEYNIDAIVLVRGGGSKMDLHVFNDYEIARAIAKCPTPVITGIGHETDEVVADLVAHANEITPTAVAKLLYVKAGVFRNQVTTSFDQIIKMVQSTLAGRKEEFHHYSKYLIHYTRDMLVHHQQRLRDGIHELHIGARELLDNERASLRLLLNKAENEAINSVELKRNRDLDVTLEKIEMYAENLIDKGRVQVTNLNELLSYLNPESLLKKGYTISSINNTELNDLAEIETGQKMQTLSDHWLVESEILSIKNIHQNRNETQKKK